MDVLVLDARQESRVRENLPVETVVPDLHHAIDNAYREGGNRLVGRSGKGGPVDQ